MAGAGAGVGAGAGAVAGTGAVAELFTFFRSSFVFGSELSASSPDVQVQGICPHPPGCSSPGGGVSCLRAPPDVPVQGPPSWFLATPGMFQSRAVGWPPGCSSPGGRAAILLLGLLRSAAPRMLQSRGPFSCFLATPRMFQSRPVVAHHVVLSPSVCSPPDALVQGAIHLVFARQWQGLGIRWTRVSRRVILLHS